MVSTIATAFGQWFQWTLFVHGFGVWVNFIKVDREF